MKKIIDDKRIMYKVCDMYYRQDLTQQQISKKLKISRPSVSKLLTNAKKCGIIKININDSFKNKYFDLEKKLEQKYSLKEVIVVENCAHTDELQQLLARSCAQYLSRTIGEGNKIGVSMGKTLYHIAEYVEKTHIKNTTFVPLIGGVGQLQIEVHTNQIVVDLAKSFGGDYQLLHAPALVSSHSMKEQLKEENYIKPIFDMMNSVDIAVLGIGCLSEKSTLMQTGYYTADNFSLLRKKGAIGDICMYFYDENGNTEQFEVNKKVFATDIDNLKSIKYSIGVAGGEEKYHAIKGAIAGGFINVLITDYSVAKKLCED